MFDLGVSQAGFTILAQVEKDSYCQKVLKRHAPLYWPDAKLHKDVDNFGKAQVCRTIDLIFGGFPCQPFSKANRNKSETDSRNKWPEFSRIISEIRPRAVLLENVPTLTQAATVENTLQQSYALKILADLTLLGYSARWGVISAQDVGAPHIRNRWWLVAYADGTGSSQHNATTQRDSVGLYTRGFNSSGLYRRVKPRLGGSDDGPTCWLDETRWPSYPNQVQKEWEAPRTVKEKTPYRKQRVQALGNGGIWWIAYYLAKEIKEKLALDATR